MSPALRCRQCSHSARGSAGLTRPIARQGTGRCASSRDKRVRTACASASCAAEVGMELRIAAPTRPRRKDPKLRCCHCPTNFACCRRSPPDLQQPSSASGLQGGEAPPSEPLIPRPIPATTEMVEHWISSGFRQLTNISTKIPPEVGERVLWRGVKTGRRR